MENQTFALDWISIPSGKMLQMRDFQSIKLLKLDDKKACYFDFDNKATEVDINVYESKERGNYYYFQTCKEDWHPLTNRLWAVP